ncbi:hypothetical protein [Roseitranquillus sediminis]|uniref:hypothetical protein n=1 Tax=Roseitranquillus sediminis TaxID=2809051 RepID=UPI001D0C0C1F|nr:hypothetical protein [Roseitranquillus sediminis]MBM9594033.1 hypothetical protein [Roseitranquillus sediminis]
MRAFRSVILGLAAMGLTLASAPAHARGNPHHPMSVLEARISQVEDEIETLRASLNAMSPEEQSALAEEIYGLTLRLSYLNACKIHLVNLPKDEAVAFIEHVIGQVASPSNPRRFQNNGFGNGNQDAPGNSEFNNNAENAGGNN